MSYREPLIGDTVMYVDEDGELIETTVEQVIDIGAGLVMLDDVDDEVRYVDPSGARRYEPNSWHYLHDDTSRIVDG